MDFGLYLVPVLTGYWFLTHLHYTNYNVVRAAGYHVFFQSAIAGGLLFVFAQGIIYLLKLCLADDAIFVSSTLASNSAPFILCALSGFLLPPAGNKFYGREKSAAHIAEKNGYRLALLLSQSIKEQKFVELSLKSRKSYIGLILGSEITRYGEPDIALLPLASGFRDKDTLELEITTNYAPAIEQSLEASDLQYEDFQIVIPRDEVISARVFYPDAYDLFQDEKRNAP